MPEFRSIDILDILPLVLGALVVIILMTFMGLAFNDAAKQRECRQALASSAHSAADIIEICK